MLVLALAFSTHASGPLLSDSNLFAALDLTYPGLELVRTNVAQTNYPAAKANLAAYLRARTNVTWTFDPHAVTTNVSYSKSSADQTTNGHVIVGSIPYTFPGGDIDWFYNITKDTNYSYASDNEWQWQLNRMQFWPNLGSTYWGAGNDAYTAAWVRQLRDWLGSCPVPSSQQNGAGSCWRTIECGIRMGGPWPDTYHRFLLSPSFTDPDVCDHLKSCIEHARYLSNYCTIGNWLAMEMSGLYTVAALYPEMNEATSWRQFASQKLYSEETNQFYPDGVQKELSPGYHGTTVGNTLTIYNVASLEGRVAELPANYLAKLEDPYAHYLRLMTPDRKLPQFNDCIGVVDAKASLVTGYSLFTNRLDFLWVISNGASGAPPAFVSFSYPYAGYNVMRSGWGTNDNYLCLDAGPLGASHQHQDKLNVVLWSYGRRILFDSGGGDYNSSIWRSYGISAYSHNTVIVDGKNQAGGSGSTSYSNPDYVSQAPMPMRWETDVNHDFAVGVYDHGYGSYTSRPVTHTRRVLFLKPDLYLVADTLATNDASSHTYEARWHLLPTNTALDTVTRSVTTIDAGVPNLAVVPCLLSNLTVATVVARSNADYTQLLGWNIVSGQPGCRPAATVTHTLSGTGTKQFLTLLLPLPVGATNPVTNVVATGPGSSRLELFDGRKLLVSADPNPARGLKIIELLSDNSTNRLAGGGFTLPAISAITDQVTLPNTTVGPLTFTVGETNLDSTNLLVIAQSLDPRIVAGSGLVLSGSDSNRTVTVTPAPGRAGTARILLTVIDTNGATASTLFNVTVAPPASATCYWDTSPNAGLQAASGTWSDNTATWSSTNTGSNPLLTWPALGNDAVFVGAGANYAIIVSATQNVNNLAFTNGNFTLTGGALNHFLGPMTITTDGNANLNLPLTADTHFAKLGLATLTLGAPASYLGNTTVGLGTLQLTANNALPTGTDFTLGAGTNAARLDLSAASQTLASLTVATTNSTPTNFITIGVGQTLTVNGDFIVGTPVARASTALVASGPGAFVVNDPAGRLKIAAWPGTVNVPVKATCDLSALGTVSWNVGSLNVGDGDNNSGWNSTLLLATNSTCKATNLNIGTSNLGSTQTLKLGAGMNTFYVDMLNLGVGVNRDSGVLGFNSPAGTLELRSTSTNGRVNVNFGTGASTTGYGANNVFDVTGHFANLWLGTLTMGDQPNRSGTWSQNFSFDQGVLDITSVLLCRTVKNGATGSATLNLAGGTVNIGAGGASLSVCAATGTLNIKGGTVTLGGDITRGTTGAGVLTLNSTNNAILDLGGHAIGSSGAPITNLNLLAGTLRNVGELNGGSALVKSGTGTLTLAGTNRFTGSTVLNAGTLNLAGNLGSSLTVNTGLLSGCGTVAGNFTLGTGSTWRSRLSDTTPGAGYDQLTVSGAITLAGALQLAVTNSLPNGATFTILKNDGPSAVSGTFAGLPQLAGFITNGAVWRVNYAGGDGNDVTLTVQSTNTAPALKLDFASGELSARWPDMTPRLFLFCATNLAPPVWWSPAGGLPVLSNGEWALPASPLTNPALFYRLQSQ